MNQSNDESMAMASGICLSDELMRARKDLLDLSRNNRLLNYRKSKKQSLQIVDELPDEIWSRLMAGKHFEFKEIPEGFGKQDQAGLDWEDSDELRFTEELPEMNGGLRLDPRHTDDKLQTLLSSERLDTVLKQMRQAANMSVAETGVNVLHLALGLLEWYEAEHSEVKNYAPLLLVPVSLEREFIRGKYRFRLSYTGEEVQRNESLALKLRDEFQIELNEIGDDITPEAYFAEVAMAVESKNRWTVKREALLGFFSFRKLMMYRDLDPEQWGGEAGLSSRGVLRSLVAGAASEGDEPESLFLPDYDIDEHEKAHDIHLALDADSSQHSALCDLLDGKNLVIEGPPGTGKSQTITNAIAAALGEGKTVMFVAEKLAALRVVFKNLERIGLGGFCLELHSESAKPAKVYDDLKQRLSMKFPPPADVAQKRQQLEREKDHIRRYLKATNIKAGPRRERLDQVFWQVAAFRQQGIEPLYGLGVPGRHDEAEFDDCIAALKALQNHATEVGPPQEHAWRGIDLSAFRPPQLPELKRLVESWVELTQEIDQTAASLHKTAALGFEKWLLLAGGWDPVAAQALLDRVGPEPEYARLCVPLGNRDSLDSLVRELRAWHESEERFSRDALVTWEEAESQAAAAMEAWSTAVIRLPPETHPRQIAGLRARLEAMDESQRQLTAAAEELERLGHPRPRTPHEFAESVQRHRLMHHPAMADRSMLVESHFHTQAEVSYKAARDIHRRLVADEDRLGKIISLRDAPPVEEVSALRRDLQPYAQRRLRGLSLKFRRTRRRLQEFLAPGTSRRLNDHLQALLEYEEYYTARESFSTDSRLADALGPAFKGMDTDWESFKQCLAWCKTVRGIGIGFNEARELLQSRDEADAEADPSVLQQRLEAVAQELKDPLVQAALGLEDGFEETVSFAEMEQKITVSLRACRGFEAAVRCFRPKDSGMLTDVISSLENVSRGVSAHKVIAEVEQRLPMGPLFKGVETDGDAVELALTWVRDLEGLGVSEALASQLVKVDPVSAATTIFQHIDELQRQGLRWENLRTQLAAFGGLLDTTLASPSESGDDDSYHARLRELQSDLHLAAEWGNCCRARRTAVSRGLAGICDAFFDGRVEVAALADVYRATVYHEAADAAVAGDPELSDFSRQALESARERFRELDAKLIEVNRESIAAAASSHKRPSGVSQGRVGEFSEMGLIRHEINKQRRHCRIRRLVERAPRSLVGLKPCFMLSPLSVSQFLPPGSIEFDLVVMDEASQIKPEDALGTAIRAKQLVVVGDPKQLPPTSFFDKLGDDGDEGDEMAVSMDDSESVLEVAMKGFRDHRRLRWHYRSKHPSLIDFSNKKFYDDELVVFPSPSADRGKLGVRFHYVENGVFQGGCNVAEADRVANAIAEHAREHPDKTLGVGTFNAAQRQIIEDRLDSLCAEDADTRRCVDRLRDVGAEYPLFIKNLENVQGDERDVMFISYTYGLDEASGKVMQRFGPINGKQGWRRLNVLVTRAKERVEVFSSMNPQDIKPSDRSSLGVRSMREYLEFAQSGRVPDGGVATGRGPDSPFEVAVSGVVREKGYACAPQVGVAGYFIDLGVYSPGSNADFMLGIECDGATYHSSRSARDRDRLREDVIVSRGWHLHRIWSTDWFLNYDDEVRRLNHALERAAARVAGS